VEIGPWVLHSPDQTIRTKKQKTFNHLKTLNLQTDNLHNIMWGRWVFYSFLQKPSNWVFAVLVPDWRASHTKISNWELPAVHTAH
jgi:hypothetical protein